MLFFFLFESLGDTPKCLEIADNLGWSQSSLCRTNFSGSFGLTSQFRSNVVYHCTIPYQDNVFCPRPLALAHSLAGAWALLPFVLLPEFQKPILRSFFVHIHGRVRTLIKLDCRLGLRRLPLFGLNLFKNGRFSDVYKRERH